jgi:tetratricopeptide (TPR) repeat protein
MKIHFLLIAISLSLGGCSLIYSYSDNLPQRLNQWEKEKRFNLALDTIAHIKPTHENYQLVQRKKKILQKKMAAYEKMAIKKSTQLSKQGEWLQALHILDEAEENITDTTNISAHRDHLLTKRENVIAAFEKDVLNIEAANLANKSWLYKKINKTVTINERNELKISEYNELREETSLKLAKRSELQFKNNQLSKALSSIELALILNPDDDITSRLKNIKRQIKQTTRSNKSRYLNEANALLSKLSQGYSHDILIETQEKIAWLEKIKENDKDYIKVLKQLKRHLKRGIKQRFEAARRLYSKGKTQEALSIWQDLKILDPDNAKLQSHIIRAEKVLLKLKELSNKPANK